ncbi:MAG TPA: NRDE family protein [Ferruginibacter sp.]|nr:NRDE family protein [Ferruginibacter sp.]
MCTVSFVSANGKKIITSNRDEHLQRETASAPEFVQLENTKIIFPKDAKAGGTWFAASDSGMVAVLLNGAFVKHIVKPPYRKSRGLVLLDIIASEEPVSFFSKDNLEGIEPFTVILYQPRQLYELRWDGNKTYERSLDISGNYIWSSATLYTDEVIEQRRSLFNSFIEKKESLSAGSVFDFHNNNHDDVENGFIINRKTGMKTFSITQAIAEQEQICFLHNDLLQHQNFEATMQVDKSLINL